MYWYRYLFNSLVVSTTSSVGLENASFLLVVIDKASRKKFSNGPRNETAELLSLEKAVTKIEILP